MKTHTTSRVLSMGTMSTFTASVPRCTRKKAIHQVNRAATVGTCDAIGGGKQQRETRTGKD